MARQSHDREDLLAEATALVRRAELLPSDAGRPNIVVGFRANGAASVYFSPDCALHFNSQHALRRAYLDGQMLVAERGQLFALERHRTASAVELLRRELPTDETAALLTTSAQRLRSLGAELTNGALRLGRSVWEPGDATSDIIAWIDSLPDSLEIAAEPHAG